MDNTPITLENVLDQAANWTFAGDFSLLQWMNKISQDLETKANNTTEALSKLDNNVRSTNIALDNVANSLTTLQFGNQFVESRVQDDETLTNVNEAISSKENNNNEETPSSKAMLNTFLDNNLKILRNCHEKFSIDLDDSDDDEEGATEKTCIYQPINPYNERPLPYIFGSKDWYAKWHVGLYENQQDTNYSGDEISETFSDSSETPTDDNESFESNTEWTSSNSVDNNNDVNNIKVRNASTLKDSDVIATGAMSKAIQIKKSNVTTSETSSVSTASSSLAKKSLPNEIKPTRSNSINSINSNVSQRDSIKTPALTKDKTLAYCRPAAPFLDLFAEPPEDIQSIASSISSTHQTRRPSNDFSTKIPDALPKSVNQERPSLFKTSKPPPFVDLFAEPPEDKSSTTSSTVSSNQNIKRKPLNLFDSDNEDDLLPRRKVNENLDTNKKTNDLLAPLTQEKETEKLKIIVKDKPKNVSTLPKSLFDEDSDEDDDDFLRAFAKKSSSTKSALTKTLLFDDLVSESPKKPLNSNLFDQDLNDANKTSQIKESKLKRVNIFDDIEDDEDEQALFKNINKNNKTNNSKGIGDLEKKLDKSPQNNNRENIFDDPKEFEKKMDEIIDSFRAVSKGFEELDKKMGKSPPNNKRENMFDEPKEALGALEKKMGKSPPNNKTDNLFDVPKEVEKKEDEMIDSHKAPAKKKISLFDDLEDDDNDDDIFAKKPSSPESKFKQTSVKQDQDVKNAATTSNRISPEILTKSNEATIKDLNPKELPFIEKTNDINISKTIPKSLEDISDSAKEEEAKSAILENITEREPAKKPDKILDFRKDQASKSLQIIQETDNNIESLSKPQISMNKPSTDFKTAILENVSHNEPVIKPDRKLDFTKDQARKSVQNIPESTNKIESLSKPQISLNKPSKVSLKDNTNDKLKEPNNNISPNESQTNTLTENESSTSNINDLSINKTPAKLDNETPSMAKDSESSSAPTKYDFNSIIFLDEPPEDDSEFFETLNKTPKTLNTKFNSIDLEHDLYEPDLPKVPANNVAVKPVESNETKQPLLFSGLQLFSDVPPDDFEDNDNTNEVITDAVPTKRLHSVFYDDFNETLEALNKNQDITTSSPSVFPKKQPDLKDTNKDISKDVVDHNLAEAKEQDLVVGTSNKKRPVSKLLMPNININVQALLPGANATLRKAKEESKEISESKTTEKASERNQIINNKELSSKTSSVLNSKTETLAVARTAETEHILPSVTKNRVRAPINRRPSTRKARQDNYRQSLKEEDDFQVAQTSNKAIDKSTNGQQTTQKEKLKEKARDIDRETENHEDLFKKVKTPTKANISESSRLYKETVTNTKGMDTSSSTQPIAVSSKPIITKEIQKPSTSLLFDNEIEEDSKAFSTKQASKATIPTKSSEEAFKDKTISSLLFDGDDEKEENSNISQNPQVLPKNKIQTESLGKSFEDAHKRKPTSSLLFEDDEEDTFDFLKNIKTSKSKDNKETIKNKEKSLQPTSLKEKTIKPKSSLIFDDESEEDEDDFFKRLNRKDTKKVQQTKPDESILVEKQAKEETSKSTQDAQQLHTAEVEGLPTNSLPSMTSNISYKLPVKDSLTISLDEQKEKTLPKLDLNNEQKPLPKLDSNNEQIKQTKNSVNFLDDDYDDDQLFGPTKEKPIKTTSENSKKPALTLLNDNKQFVQTQIPITKQMPSFKTMDPPKGKDKFRSFSDNSSDDDDDFTVAGLQTKKSSQATKPTTAATTSTKTTTQPKTQKSNSSKLFDESDTDSDDLFGKISPKTTLNKQQPINTTKNSTSNQANISTKSMKTAKPPASSLFSDDSDEGHNLPKPSGSVTKKVTPKSSTKEKSSKVPAQSNASLFSDLDSDEDDLFGGAGVTTKPTAASIPSNVKTTTATTSPPVAKTMLQTSKAKTSADNPLADLL